MKKNKVIYIALFAVLILSIILSIVIPSNNVFNSVFRIIGIIDSVGLAIYALTKKQSVFKILTIAILVSVALSYFISGTTMTYGAVEKGTVMPIPFADVFTNGITSFSAFLTLFIYILVIGAFYGVLNKTGKYEKMVNNVAVTFNKNKGLFVVITIFVLALVTMFTGEMYSMLIFVPFLISVVRKLGFSKETSIAATVGAIIIGLSGSLFTTYTNQMLSLTVKDNVLPKVIITLVGIVTLVGFILVFGKRPAKTKDLKIEKDAKSAPTLIILGVIFIILVLGFVNWNGYFGFKGFDTFLETLRKGQISKVSVFDAFLGKGLVSFGNWQPFNAAILFTFVTVLIGLIYNEGIDGFLEGFAKGLKKAFPYALIVVLANIVLVNVYSSGIFYTITLDLTKKTVSLLTGSVTSALAAVFYPDYAYGTQFTMTAILNTSAKEYQNLFAVVFQAIYSLFLLISPTSIIVLLALRYTDTSYKDWFKYIIKYFLVLVITVLVIISISINGFSAPSIVALILLIAVYAVLVYMRYTKLTETPVEKVEKEVVKVEKKVEKKVEETKKTVAKKTTKKPAKKTTKKTNKK